MKNTLLVLLVIAVVLIFNVESRRGDKPRKGSKPEKGIGRPKKQGCAKNCVKCDKSDNGRRRTCQECDHGFAKITWRRFNKTICVPCAKQMPKKGRRVIRDESKCPTEPVTEAPCPKNCAGCDHGVCRECDADFALVSKRNNVTFCISCDAVRKAKKFDIRDKSKCPARCSKGCFNCTDGVCNECRNGLRLNPKTKQCEKKKVATDCGKGCLSCKSGICAECEGDLTLSRTKRRCVKLCTAGDPDFKSAECKKKRKEGGNKKPKRKGGRRRPKVKTTIAPAP